VVRLRELLKNVNISEIIGKDDADIKGMAIHSRQVNEGFLFVCMKGKNTDGHEYIDHAIERGAVAVVCERYPEFSTDTAVIVKDSRRAAAIMASNFYNQPSKRLRIAGITGTNGKTTVAYLCRNILMEAGERTGLISTIEYVINGRTIPADRTTPDTVLIQSLLREMADNGCTSVIMEVSSHALDQHRVDNIVFDAAIFTNLTHDHLDYHGSMEQYLEAKMRLFTELLQGSGKDFPRAAVINADDPVSNKIIESTTAPVLRYGIDGPYDVRASGIRLGMTGTSLKVSTPAGDLELETPLVGRHNVYNILAAAGLAVSQRIPLEAISRGIHATRHIPGRLQFIPNEMGISVAVDYAHTDDALKNVITALREISTGRIIVVFGCGGDRDAEKRPKMGQVVCDLADLAIVTSDNPRSEDPESIIDQVIEGFDNTGCEHVKLIDRGEAIRRGLELAKPGDTVLLAGKGHETYQQFKDNIVVFDDREVARKILGEMVGRCST
jgi:UDP-N-acetylmuramoyl-L-alanyl-D-glutamate--2,6-diaminopimelate ligase